MRNQVSDLRRRAYDAQAGLCFYCQFPMWISDPRDFARRWAIPISAVHRFRCTAEHLVPVSQGGRTEPGNIIAAYWFCNQTRHRSREVRTPARYVEHVSRGVAAGRGIRLRHRIHPCASDCVTTSPDPPIVGQVARAPDGSPGRREFRGSSSCFVVLSRDELQRASRSM
jgi:hypothetical protein